MNTRIDKFEVSPADGVVLSEGSLNVNLCDGRTVTVPLAWYPRLENATVDERTNWKLIGGGRGIHWSDVDEDISVEALIEGKSSTESQSSLKKWLESRENGGC